MWIGRHELDEGEAEELGRRLIAFAVGGQSLFFALLALATHDPRFGFVALASPVLFYVSAFTFGTVWDWWRERQWLKSRRWVKGELHVVPDRQSEIVAQRWACGDCGDHIDVGDGESIRLALEMGWRPHTGPGSNAFDHYLCPRHSQRLDHD